MAQKSIQQSVQTGRMNDPRSEEMRANLIENSPHAFLPQSSESSGSGEASLRRLVLSAERSSSTKQEKLQRKIDSVILSAARCGRVRFDKKESSVNPLVVGIWICDPVHALRVCVCRCHFAKWPISGAEHRGNSLKQ